MVTAVTVVVGECIQGQDRSPGSRPACRTNRCTTASTSLTSTAHRRHRRADEPNPSASPPAASGQTERWRCALRVFEPGALKLARGGRRRFFTRPRPDIRRSKELTQIRSPCCLYRRCVALEPAMGLGFKLRGLLCRIFLGLRRPLQKQPWARRECRAILVVRWWWSVRRD